MAEHDAGMDEPQKTLMTESDMAALQVAPSQQQSQPTQRRPASPANIDECWETLGEMVPKQSADLHGAINTVMWSIAWIV